MHRAPLRIILGDPCNNYVKKPLVQTLNLRNETCCPSTQGLSMHDLSLKESRMYLQVLALILKPALPQFVTARCVACSASLAFLASTNAARVV